MGAAPAGPMPAAVAALPEAEPAPPPAPTEVAEVATLVPAEPEPPAAPEAGATAPALVLPPGWERVEPARAGPFSVPASAASPALSFGPVVSALGFDAAPGPAAPAGTGAAVEERWVCSPSGAGAISGCGLVAVTRSVLP
jgi:hypothetical protein